MKARRIPGLSPVFSTLALLSIATALSCSSDSEPNEGGGDETTGDGDGASAAIPIDSDGDGVVDGVDTDGDGVIDIAGTPIDSDGDGVIDGLDTDGDGTIDVSIPASGGDGDVAATGGSPGGDGDGDGDVTATGGMPGVGGNGDENEGGGATPTGFASCASTMSIQELGGAYSTEDNSGPDSHGAMYGANPRLVPAPRLDGTFDVAWQNSVGADTLYVSHIAEEGGSYSVSWTLQVPSLGVVGGLAVDPSGEPVVVTAVDERIAGDVDPVEVHRPDIMAVVRLGDDCMEKYRQDLRTDFGGNSERLPLYSPFTAGTSRLSVGGGVYVVHYSQNTEYDDAVNSRHQMGRFLVGSSETGALSSEHWNISHSFDQRLHFDGSAFVSLSLGDAYSRALVQSRMSTTGDLNAFPILAIKGGDGSTGGGYNNTFTRLGDIKHSQSGYVAIFSTEQDPTYPERVSDSRNIGLVHSPANFHELERNGNYEVTISDTAQGNDSTTSWDVDVNFGSASVGKNSQVAWITNYDNRETEHAERPKLVRWNDNRFFVIWELWSLNDYQATYATIIDEWGNTIESAVSLGAARLPRGDDAFLINGQAAWLEGTGGNIVLHLLDTDLNHTTQTL